MPPMRQPDLPMNHVCAYCGRPTYQGPHACEHSVFPACCVNCVDLWEPVLRSDCDDATLEAADQSRRESETASERHRLAWERNRAG